MDKKILILEVLERNKPVQKKPACVHILRSIMLPR